MSPQKLLRSVLAAVIVVSPSAMAGLDIVRTTPGDETSALVVKNLETGKVIGTFWDPATGTGHFGFSSDNAPELLWSPDRVYLAANPADSNARWACASLFRAAGEALEAVVLPELPPGSAEALQAVRAAPQLACDRTLAVRWQKDGSLLLSYDAASRETGTTPQVTARLWADVGFNGTTATVKATLPTEPPPGSTVADVISASLAAAIAPPAVPDESP